MSTPDPAVPELRTAILAGMRELLDLLEAQPTLPLPVIAGGRATWHVYNGRRKVAVIEEILGIPLTGAIDPENDTYYLLSGNLRGMPVEIRAWASDVAERRVTGTRVVEDVEWVRIPVASETPAAEAGEDEDEGDA